MALQGIRLGPPLVYEDTYQFDTAKIVAKCEELAVMTPNFETAFQTSLEVGAAGSTAAGQYAPNRMILGSRQPHLWPEMKDFVNWVKPIANRILKEWEIDYDKVAIVNSWVNRHRKGGWTNWHVHNNTDLNIAAYISVPPDSGSLVMADPLEYHWSGYNAYRKINGAGGYILPVETNKVYFFPSFMRHSTLSSNSDEDRWVLSMNFKTSKNI
jgi:Putative 2OG-Fe(II) oxygenase